MTAYAGKDLPEDATVRLPLGTGEGFFITFVSRFMHGSCSQAAQNLALMG
jgi:hypothetical protein